jgi:hypothetical protein
MPPGRRGAKTTPTVHEEPAAIGLPHVLETRVKSPASGPVTETETAPDAAWPALVTV